MFWPEVDEMNKPLTGLGLGHLRDVTYSTIKNLLAGVPES
jgi:hypothetical protein